MSFSLKIKSERAEMLSYVELEPSERVEFDYVESEEMWSPRFFSFTMGTGETEHVEWYDSQEFLPSTNPALRYWDGFHADTFFSAVLIKFLEGDDEGFLRVAFTYS